MQEIWVRSLGWEESLEKKWQPTPAVLPGKSHGQRSLVGYSPWGSKEPDTTEPLHFTSLVQLLSLVQIFAILWTAARQASLSCTEFWRLLKLMSLELVMPSNHLVFCHPFSSCLQSFPASWSFLMSWLFTSGGQSIGASASASILPMNIQD